MYIFLYLPTVYCSAVWLCGSSNGMLRNKHCLLNDSLHVIGPITSHLLLHWINAKPQRGPAGGRVSLRHKAALSLHSSRLSLIQDDALIVGTWGWESKCPWGCYQDTWTHTHTHTLWCSSKDVYFSGNTSDIVNNRGLEQSRTTTPHWTDSMEQPSKWSHHSLLIHTVWVVN